MNGNQVKGSVNILVRDARGRTLLQMRDSAARSGALLWGFWGGAVDAEDASVCHAGARELSEELSVAAAPEDFTAIWERVDSRGHVATLLLYQRPLDWKDICVTEGAGAAFFWRDEIVRLPVSGPVAWYLERRPDVFGAPRTSSDSD